MGVLGSIVGGIIQGGAAKSAAGAQEQSQLQALQNSQQNQQASIGAQTGATAQQTANASPYTSLGASSANQLQQLLAPGRIAFAGMEPAISSSYRSPSGSHPGLPVPASARRAGLTELCGGAWRNRQRRHGQGA